MPSTISSRAKYKMELECKKRIGEDSYAFYFPIEIGEFLVHSYAKNPDVASSRLFSVSLYESGNIVKPDTDRRFSAKYWARLTEGSLGSKDLYHLFRDLDTAEVTV